MSFRRLQRRARIQIRLKDKGGGHLVASGLALGRRKVRPAHGVFGLGGREPFVPHGHGHRQGRPQGLDGALGPAGLLAAPAVKKQGHAHNNPLGRVLGYKALDGLDKVLSPPGLELHQGGGDCPAGVADGHPYPPLSQVQADHSHGASYIATDGLLASRHPAIIGTGVRSDWWNE